MSEPIPPDALPDPAGSTEESAPPVESSVVERTESPSRVAEPEPEAQAFTAQAAVVAPTPPAAVAMAGGSAPAGAVVFGPRPMLLTTGGLLGIAACVVGLVILLSLCAGFSRISSLAVVPIALGAVGFFLTALGAVGEKQKIGIDDTHVLAAFFVSLLGVIGGLVELAVYRDWTTFR